MFDSLLGPFFYLILGSSILLVTFTMFVNFVRGIAVIGAGIALIYYFMIADNLMRIKLDNYANNIISISKETNIVNLDKFILEKNKLEEKAKEILN